MPPASAGTVDPGTERLGGGTMETDETGQTKRDGEFSKGAKIKQGVGCRPQLSLQQTRRAVGAPHGPLCSLWACRVPPISKPHSPNAPTVPPDARRLISDRSRPPTLDVGEGSSSSREAVIAKEQSCIQSTTLLVNWDGVETKCDGTPALKGSPASRCL